MSFLRRFRRSSPPASLGPADYAELAFLAAAELGPDLVPDPSRLAVPFEAARVNLPEFGALAVGRPRADWPGIAREYYAETSAMIQRGADLERRAHSLETSRPYLEEMWRPEGDAAGIARIRGPVEDTSRCLILNDVFSRPQTLRAIGESRLAEMGTEPDAALRIVQERVEATAVKRFAPHAEHPRIIGLDLTPHVWAMTVIQCLDVVAPDAIGPLGTLVVLLAHNLLLVRPIGFDDGVREDFGFLAATTATAETSPVLPSPGPFWRRTEGALFPIDVSIRQGDRISVNLDDQRFRGVLMAAEPTQELSVPRWCSGVLDGARYTRLAGVVAAYSTPPPMPELVGSLDPEVLRPLARRCAGTRLAVWPRLVGLTHRLAVRWRPAAAPWTPGVAPRRETSNLSEASDLVRMNAGPLVEILAETVGPMADILDACLYFATGLRVRGAAAPIEIAAASVVVEAELVVLVALAESANIEASTDRLLVALAQALPLETFGVVELTSPEDPRFADLDHVVRLR